MLFNAIFYGFGFFDICLAILSVIFSVRFLNKLRWRERLASVFILFYTYLSTSFLAFSHLVPPVWDTTDLERIAIFGNKLYFIVMFVVFAVDLFKKKISYPQDKYEGRYFITDNQVRLFFIVSFVLSAISYALGVSVMGAASTDLPFHLSGVIHNYRVIFAPLFFMIIVENRTLHNKTIPRKWFLLFLIWCLFEAFLRISKSSVALGMLPVILFLILYYRPSLKKIAIYLLPFAALTLFLYSVIGGMRGAGKATIEGFEESRKARQISEVDPEWGNTFVGAFNRTFMTGYHYRTDYTSYNHNDWFDFSRLPVIVLFQGTAYYITYVLHNQSDDKMNSDGTTGIIDPLLIGGFGFCYLIVALTTFMSIVGDKKAQGCYSIQVINGMIFFYLIMGGTLSWMLVQNEFSHYVTRGIAIYIALRLNYKYRQKKTT